MESRQAIFLRIWYVYALAHPDDTVFYIGKGTVNAREDIRCRMNDHEREARLGYRSRKCDVIRQVWEQGQEIKKFKIYECDTEEEAKMLERSLIILMNGPGLLTNTAHNSMHSSEQRALQDPKPRIKRAAPVVVKAQKPKKAEKTKIVPVAPVKPQGSATKEVADMLGVTPRTVTRLAERGEIPGFKVGDVWRFHRQDILDYIEEQKQKRRPPAKE